MLATSMFTTVLTGCGVAEPGRSIATVVAGWQDTPYGKPAVINSDNGELVVIKEGGIPVKVQLIPVKRAYETAESEGKVAVRREPSGEVSPEFVWPSQVRTDYAVRIAGKPYQDEKEFGQQKVEYGGAEYTVGRWFVLTDEQGRYVSPMGQVLQDGEKPFYVKASEVTVVPKEEARADVNLAQLEPIGFYNGTVTIDKGVNIRSGTKIKPDVPAETNVIPWNKIVSMNGVKIEDGKQVIVMRPLLVNGQNPTEDPGIYASSWMAFWVEVRVREKPEQIMLVKAYINLSRKTIPDYVKPDQLDWYNKLVGVQIVNGNLSAVGSGDRITPEKFGVVSISSR